MADPPGAEAARGYIAAVLHPWASGAGRKTLRCRSRKLGPPARPPTGRSGRPLPTSVGHGRRTHALAVAVARHPVAFCDGEVTGCTAVKPPAASPFRGRLLPCGADAAGKGVSAVAKRGPVCDVREADRGDGGLPAGGTGAVSRVPTCRLPIARSSSGSTPTARRHIRKAAAARSGSVKTEALKRYRGGRDGVGARPRRGAPACSRPDGGPPVTAR